MNVARVRMYEIGDQLEALDAKSADQGGVLSDEEFAILDRLEGEFEDKAVRIASLVKDAEMEADIISVEMERLGKHRDTRNALALNLKAYLKREMERLDIPKIKTPTRKIRIQKNSRPSVNYIGDDKIAFDDVPAVFVRTRYQLDKQAILKAIESELTIGIPDSIKIETGTHLRID